MRRTAVFIATLLWGMLRIVPSALPAQTIGSVSYDVVGTSMPVERIKTLVGVRDGMVLNQAYLDTRMEELRKTGLFSDIHYDLKRNAKNHVDLHVTVHEARTVALVKIKGAYPFLDKDIRKLLALQTGSPLQKGLIESAEIQIREYLEKNGFYDSTVKIHITPHRHPDKANLEVHIQKGKRYRVKQVVLNGVENLNLSRVSNKVSRSSRFSLTRLRENLKAVRKLYSRKGFIKARVNLKALEFNEAEHSVNITIDIKENRKLQLHFSGHKMFSSSRLRQVVNYEESRSYDRFSVEDSILKLEEFYHGAGYPDAHIASSMDRTDDRLVRVAYQIDAGDRVELSHIRFVGNEHIGAKRLRRKMGSEESSLFKRSVFQPERLVLDRRKLENYYRDQGFLDASVDVPELSASRMGDHREALYHVAEGPGYRIGNITVSADKAVDTELLRRKSGLKSGKMLEAEIINSAASRISDELHEMGYAYAQVDIESSTRTLGGESLADIAVRVILGDIVRVRHVIVSGNYITKGKVILKNLKIRPGEVFVYQRMLDGQQRLRKLGIFSSVSLQPLGFESHESEMDLLVSVRERNTVTMEMEAGFDTINLASGEINLSKKNLFGLAKQFNVRAIGGLHFDRLEGTFISPRLFGASWNLANQYFGQYENNRNFNAVSFGSSLSTLKNYGPYWTVGFREQLTRTDIIESASNQQLGSALFDNTLNEMQASVTYDIRDNYSDPQKGINAYLKNEFSFDLANSDNLFYTLEANLAHYQGFLKRFTLVNTLRYMHVFKLRDAAIVPVNKLFFLGGDDTLRGFEQDAIDDTGGRIALIYNAELHFRLFDSFKIAGFFDAGSLTDAFRQIERDSFRESAGVGIRYFTPIGPIRLDLGFILDRQTNEPKRRLHFSFGYFF